jgi:hypothetical protein
MPRLYYDDACLQAFFHSLLTCLLEAALMGCVMANNLPTEKKALAVPLLCEDSSIRAIERIAGVHRDTIMRLGVR